MTWTPRIIDGGSSLLLPRGSAHGEANWPRCAVCLRSVDAYGIDENTRKYIELWARCDGIAGPYGGKHVRSYRAGIRIDKTAWPGGWTENTSVDILARLVLRPGKFAKWALQLGNPDTVRAT